jgi:GNAT superfamily N-acetyltransferase
MLSIEPATHADVPAMADLLVMLFCLESDFVPDVEKHRRGLSLILDNPYVGRIFVARQDGQVLGLVSLLLTISTAEGAAVCWLEDMVVHPDHQSRGIGSALLQHAVREAWRMGLRRVTLLADRLNERAMRFYQRRGFQRSDMLPWRLYPPDRDPA